MSVAARPAQSCPTADARAVAAWLGSRLGQGAQLHADSRRLRPGDAFFAWPGAAADGRLHIDTARSKGASAIVAEAEAPAPSAAHDLYAVRDLRAHAGEIASYFYGEPSARLQLIAVTGTNGKTSCAHWLAQGLARSGRRSALIGTLGSGLLDDSGVPSLTHFGLTMPDALSLHAMFAQFLAAGARAVVMEASSIGLHQHRLSGACPAVAVLTNLSRDHLDYHGSEEAYAQAKLLLFRMQGLKAAVLNAEDALSQRALAVLPEGCRAIVYGSGRTQAMYPKAQHLIATRIGEHPEGLSLELDGDFGKAELKLPLLGRFNAMNALAVAAGWLALDVPFAQAVSQLERLQPVPGRLERVSADSADGGSLAAAVSAESTGPCVVVDYAHTPDALEKVLDALRPLAVSRAGRLWCVFGAGGERDAGKRPQMGSVASRLADLVVLTSDNPRSESPHAILNEIAGGLSRPAHLVQADRREAIRSAVAQARPQDVVLIAGKGHERWQELASARVPFDDVAEARAALKLRSGATHA